MIGKYPAKLDDKNRLFVPAKLRGELGDAFFVVRWQKKRKFMEKKLKFPRYCSKMNFTLQYT